MNYRVIFRVLGLLIAATSAAMILPVAVSLFEGGSDWRYLTIVMLAGTGVGTGLAWLLRGSADLEVREGFVIVTLGWLSATLVASLPFYLHGAIGSFTDAFFESMSGFTTTGSTILTDIEALPRGLALWRCQIQWLGGMGIVVLSLAILPILGVGGMQLFQAEAPGPSPDRLTPRIKETARLLWGAYCILSLAEVVALMICGMGPYDALCHTFTTMATGGFSPKAASVGHYSSAAIDWVITFFMFAAGVNFSLHFFAVRGRGPRGLRRYWRDHEFRTYLAVALGAIALVMVSNWRTVGYGLADNLRYSSFQVVSILTTTGFATADYEHWSRFVQLLLLMLMFVGGCAGSTGGGMKNVRVLLLAKHAWQELRKLLHPRAVYVLRFNRQPVGPQVVTNILGFFLLLVMVAVAATLAMTAMGMDLVSAFGSVAATLNNVGPGVGTVGPADNFAHVPVLGKWVLVACMLLGRLELYTVLVLLTPGLWRRT
jgi:trk system potassium uptake protein TrkH